MKQVIKALVLMLLPLSAWSQVKVNALPSGSTPSSGDYTIFDQSGTTNKCTMAQLETYIASQLGTFATQNYATPPVIGGTTPNTGQFTILAASTSVISPAADFATIGAITPGSGAFTTLTTPGFSVDTNGNVAIGAATVTVTVQSSTETTARPIAGSQDVQTFTSSGTWTAPSPGYKSVRVIVVGAGGGGGGGTTTASSTTNSGGSGGGGGASWDVTYLPSAITSSVTVTIGAAGTAGAVNTAGGIGGNTTFGGYVTAFGGGGGAAGQSSVSSGGGGGAGSRVAGSSGTGGGGGGG